MEKRMTIKELAKILNVSISTVSKALNDSDEISDETITRVKETAQLYGYRPNFIAKSLKSRSTKTLGVIVPDILNYFFVQLLHGVEKEARLQGYNVLTCISHETLANEKANIIALTNGQVDGILFCPSEETQDKKDYKHIQSLINSGIPIVTFDRSLEQIECNSVTSNDFESGYEVTKYLLSRGSKHIKLFASHRGLNVIKERIIGFKQAMREHDMLEEDSVLDIPDAPKDEAFITHYLSNHKIDGIITINELLSVKAVKIARNLSISIPKNLQIIGFSNGEISAQYNPAISSVDQCARIMGKEAVLSMLNILNNGKDKKIEVKTVPSILIHRETTTL